jgi:hypothetical protein
MKKSLVILMAMGMFSAMPVLAADHAGMDMSSHQGMKMDTPDGPRECALQAETIQKKISRLNAEVAAGKKQHNPEEMKVLERKLKETNELLDKMGR